MFTPQVAFALGYGPAKLQAAHVERADIAKLPELAHVVTLELRTRASATPTSKPSRRRRRR
jgi:hypothetical protein